MRDVLLHPSLHSDNPVTVSFHIWAHCTYGWWCRCQDDSSCSVPQNWKRPPECPCIMWLNTVQRDRQPTTSHWTKQSTWPRTVLCGGWCLRMALRTPRGACQKRRRRRPFVPKENLLSNLVHVFIYVMTENEDSPSMCWAVVELKWHFCFVSLSFVT